MRYEWRAIYSDGTHLDQINQDGSEAKYTDIDRNKLCAFVLFDETKTAKVVLHLQPGQKLVHRVRRLKHMPLSNLFWEKHDCTEEAVWIVGFHENRNGTNVQMLSFIFEDGHVELMDKWRDDHALYAPVNLIEQER